MKYYVAFLLLMCISICGCSDSPVEQLTTDRNKMDNLYQKYLRSNQVAKLSLKDQVFDIFQDCEVKVYLKGDVKSKADDSFKISSALAFIGYTSKISDSLPPDVNVPVYLNDKYQFSISKE